MSIFIGILWGPLRLSSSDQPSRHITITRTTDTNTGLVAVHTLLTALDSGLDCKYQVHRVVCGVRDQAQIPCEGAVEGPKVGAWHSSVP